MRRGELFIIAFIVMLFLSMGYAIITTAANAANELEAPAAQLWTPPDIEQCELPLWDRIRYLCPEEEQND